MITIQEQQWYNYCFVVEMISYSSSRSFLATKLWRVGDTWTDPIMMLKYKYSYTVI